MSRISIEELCHPIAADARAGEDVSELTEYYVLEDMVNAAGGLTGAEAVGETQWPKVLDAAVELLQRGKELRVVVHLIEALVRLDGFAGLRDGLGLLARLLEEYWDDLYPALDADEDNPAMARMNILRELSSGALGGETISAVVNAVREVKLCNSRQLGSFSWREVQLALGEIAAPAGTAAPQLALIEGAIRDTDRGDSGALVQALEQASACVGAMDRFLTAKLAANNTSQLAKLATLLGLIQGRVQAGLNVAGPAVATPTPTEPPPGTPVSASRSRGSGASGAIASEADVIRALDAICTWYEANQRSSPVPYFLKRAKRLVGKDFMAIVKDVARSAEEQVKELLGSTAEGE